MYLKQIQLGNNSAMAREVMNLRLSQAGNYESHHIVPTSYTSNMSNLPSIS